MKTETLEEDEALGFERGDAPCPALVVLFSGDRAKCVELPLEDGALVVGRDLLASVGIQDSRVSRQHLRVERSGTQWSLQDLESRNGSFVDGRPFQRAKLNAPLLRVGRTLLLPVLDGRPFRTQGVVERNGALFGPLSQAAHARIAAAARSGANLLLRGESGTGKELAAATFHTHARGEAGDRSGPLVAINCATIPRELAERTLFGAARGAYTGAVESASGLVQSADGGTLFLDEVAELDLGVQAKLLRVLETKKVLPLGALKPVTVDLRLCAATLKDLRAEVAEGRFRSDLYFRLGRPAVVLPPLRERREEIPWLLERALEGAAESASVTAGVEFVEACLLRPWPGNVRELLAETRAAALAAFSAQRTVLSAADLDEEAGRSLDKEEESAPAEERPEAAPLEPGAVEAALRAEQGNVARAAARLGITRARLRRLIARDNIDVRAFRPA